MARLTLATAVLAVLLSACGSDSAGNPESNLTLDEATAPLEDGSPALQGLREQANELIEGGPEDFEARIDELRGTPIVVNAWASWCGPCRTEFPFFQSQAIERQDSVAFIGLNVADGPDTAKTFLAQLPLPFPSYLDPGSGVGDAKIAASLAVGPGLPNTIFIDESGEVAYHWRGSYEDEAQLSDQIDTYLK
jgi:thiol-disulfide isomerase/thioredoxin